MTEIVVVGDGRERITSLDGGPVPRHGDLIRAYGCQYRVHEVVHDAADDLDTTAPRVVVRVVDVTPYPEVEEEADCE